MTTSISELLDQINRVTRHLFEGRGEQRTVNLQQQNLCVWLSNAEQAIEFFSSGGSSETISILISALVLAIRALVQPRWQHRGPRKLVYATLLLLPLFVMRRLIPDLAESSA